jgi:hypothetical protein
MHASRVAVLAALLGLLTVSLAAAEDPEIARRRAAERKAFSDAEIIEGFFKLTFGAEFHLAGRVDRIRKYDVPVRVYIDNRAKPNRTSQVAAVIADIAAHVANLQITRVERRDDANIVVTLVRDRDLPRTIRALYGVNRARRIQRSLEPQCLSGFRKDDSFRILHSDVLLAADVSDFVFYDCVYEELLQALGPINDDASLPWSMFNDDVQMGFFDVYDQYILNILYDPRIRPGMTQEQVQGLLPEVLPAARAFVEGRPRQ